MSENTTQATKVAVEEMILILKLSSGEEILSEGYGDDLNFYLVNPVQIIQYPDEASQQMKVGMVPFMPYATRDGVCLSRIGTHIAIPSEGLLRSYREFTTGIALPDMKIQLA